METAHGPRGPEVANSLAGLARVHRARGDLPGARETLARALGDLPIDLRTGQP